MKDAKITHFPDGDVSKMNIKFFPGRSKDVTPEQLRAELERADEQVRQGVAIKVPMID